MPKEPFPDPAKLVQVLKDAVRDQAVEGVRFMSEYPRQSSGSSYRRTGTLRRSWHFTVEMNSGNIEGNIMSNSNIAPYNKDVQGEEQSPWMTDLGWRNIKGLGEKIDRDFPPRVELLVEEAYK